jgi:hypothetical protein
MPRIGGGGGPVGPPPGAAPSQGASQAGKTDFAAKVSQAQATSQATAATQTSQAQQAKAAQSQLTGKARDIAKRFSTGNLKQKEAFREFVSLVIEERFPQFKKKKKKKKKDDKDEDQNSEERLEEAVTELIDRDPALAKRLKEQFQKLAKG